MIFTVKKTHYNPVALFQILEYFHLSQIPLFESLCTGHSLKPKVRLLWKLFDGDIIAKITRRTQESRLVKETVLWMWGKTKHFYGELTLSHLPISSVQSMFLTLEFGMQCRIMPKRHLRYTYLLYRFSILYFVWWNF